MLDQTTIDTICKVLSVFPEEIYDVHTQKAGMTNRSYSFSVRSKTYMIRIPREGTKELINRKQEWEVYQVLKSQNICDHLVFIDPDSGIKISEFITNARVCNPFDEKDLLACMGKLRDFHNLNLRVPHTFDLFEKIEFYENLYKHTLHNDPSYHDVKKRVFSLRDFIASCNTSFCLSHIDAVHDNFVFDKKGNLYLIDWEYAGMQDPHIDIAMFCIYAMYEKSDVDRLINLYFKGDCPYKTRLKIYCYISACGLLWSNWCKYKSTLGVDFGFYAKRQYEYALEYYSYVSKELDYHVSS